MENNTAMSPTLTPEEIEKQDKDQLRWALNKISKQVDQSLSPDEGNHWEIVRALLFHRCRLFPLPTTNDTFNG